MVQKYCGSQTLENNMKYTVTVITPYFTKEWSFTSRYDPMYSTAKAVRSVTGSLLNEVSNRDINYAIYQTSLDIKDRLAEAGITNPKERALSEYVKYQTAVNLLYAVYLDLAANSGLQQYTLGKLQVQKQIRPPELEDLLGVLRRQAETWEQRLFGSTVLGITSAVKAARTYPYPDNMRRSF